MKYCIPIYVTVEAVSPTHAQQMKKSVEQLLTNPLVKSLLAGQRVTAQHILVAEPVPDPTAS